MKWEAWSSNEDFFQLLAIIPLIEGILTRAHISFTMDTETLYIDPICAQAIWNTGILDEHISEDSEQLPEEILGGVGAIVEQLTTLADQPSGLIIRALHNLFHTQVNDDSCRPWLWGHTNQ